MKLRRKKNLTTGTLQKDSLEKAKFVPADACQAFLSECREQENESVRQYRAILLKWYSRVFPTGFFPETRSLHAIKLAIGYQLLLLAYQKAKRPVPASILKNHSGAVNFTSHTMTSAMQSLYESWEKTNANP